jgi:Beta-eliminating lyase
MPATAELPLAEQREVRDQCTVFLAGHGPVTAAGLLAGIPADTVTDRYGSGGVVAELEIEVGGLLGKPAAVFLPSGTMAQQSVLRVHADRRQRRTVIFHPMCHLHRHEGEAYQRLHGLTGRPAGEPDRLMTIDDLTAIPEPAAALLIELPQRDLGGQQPGWEICRLMWPGAAYRNRTDDLRITRGMVACNTGATCADSTARCTDGTLYPGLLPLTVPRGVPRRAPLNQPGT